MVVYNITFGKREVFGFSLLREIGYKKVKS